MRNDITINDEIKEDINGEILKGIPNGSLMKYLKESQRKLRKNPAGILDAVSGITRRRILIEIPGATNE